MASLLCQVFMTSLFLICLSVHEQNVSNVQHTASQRTRWAHFTLTSFLCSPHTRANFYFAIFSMTSVLIEKLACQYFSEKKIGAWKLVTANMLVCEGLCTWFGLVRPF